MFLYKLTVVGLHYFNVTFCIIEIQDITFVINNKYKRIPLFL